MKPVIWIFGRPGSGKTTLGKALCADWDGLLMQRAFLLDAEEFRKFTGNRDYSGGGRWVNIKGLCETAQFLAQQFPVVVAAVTPFHAHQNHIRDNFPHFRMIHLMASEALCKERGKPLWADSRFEEPHGSGHLTLSAEIPVEKNAHLIRTLVSSPP